MRVVLPLLALFLTTAAAPPAVPAPDAPPGQGDLRADPRAVCNDRIIEVRKERGLPELQRKTAQPDEPLFIAAVDQRIGGCSVLVMRNDTSDIRPLPAIENDGRLQRIPAR